MLNHWLVTNNLVWLPHSPCDLNNPPMFLVPLFSAFRKCSQTRGFWQGGDETDECMWLSLTVDPFKAWAGTSLSPVHTFHPRSPHLLQILDPD